MMNRSLVCFLAAAIAAPVYAQSYPQLAIDTSTTVSPVSPSLYGLMTEEINFSYDGGLYAEMVRNRTFTRDWAGFEHWTLAIEGEAKASISEGKDGPSAALPKSLALTIQQASPGNEAGLANPGYWGMAVRPATTYRGSFYAKASGVGDARVELVADNTGASLASTRVTTTDGIWKRYDFALTTRGDLQPGKDNHLTITFAHAGTAELQLVSLFPPTFNDRPNGNRPDLMQMMAAMKPAFLRLPGGNYLEGNTIKDRFNWKETIGPLVDRPTHRGPWNGQSTDGLGLLEFLEWCEDLKIKPLLAVYAGFSLRGEHVTGPQLEPYVQDALDEIEYVTGDSNTKWGALRARDGHPAPFALDYVEIGNEDDLDHSHTYDQRYQAFEAAIRAKYPVLKLIATTAVKSGHPDLVDDHYYKTPDEFFDLVHRYDQADRKGPKVFVGEWATRTGSPTPDFGAALGDAAWMTGLERNSDLIVMASYAPLLTNVDPGGMQWSTDLIGYDSLRAYASPSYWAQVLFAGHLGQETVKSVASGVSSKLFWSATVSRKQKKLYLKLVNASDKTEELDLSIPNAMPGPAASFSLHGATRFETNTLEHPDTIHPVTAEVEIPKGPWHYRLAANTIMVIDIPLNPEKPYQQ